MHLKVDWWCVQQNFTEVLHTCVVSPLYMYDTDYNSVLGCPRNKQKLISVRTETNRNKICFAFFRFVSWNQKLNFLVCFGVLISKQPKQTDLLCNKPKQTKRIQNFLENTQIYSLLSRHFGQNRILSTRFLSDQWAAVPLQRVANQWVAWGGRFNSIQFKTAFNPQQ